MRGSSLKVARGTRHTAVLAASVLVLSLIGGEVAQGEIEKKGNVLVVFNANLSPKRLPQDRFAPVGVTMGGKVRTTDRSEPPTLTHMRLAINKHGRLSTRGLPRCTQAQIAASNTQTALATCRRALVGRGNATTRVTLPGQGTFASNGRLLAFNAKVGGRPGILAHVHGERPLSLTYVIRFRIQRSKGPFGTTLIAKIPSIASGQGRISAFNLSLRRNYRHRGKRMSYLRARCATPRGIRFASFPFAKVSYTFSDNRTVSSVLRRECRVRR